MYKSLKRLDYPRHLAFLNEKKLILVRKLTKSDPWEDITNTRYDITKLIFFDPELNEFKPEYKLDLLNLIIEIKLEEFCEKLEYYGMKIYNYKSYMEHGYPEILLFDILKNTFTLEFLNEKKIKLHIPKVVTPVTQVIPTEVDKINRTITRSLKRHIESNNVANTKIRKLNEQINEPIEVPKDLNVELDDIELNTKKYEIKILNQCCWYKFNKNNCNYIKVLGKKLWKRKGSEVLKSFYYYKFIKILIIEFDTYFILFRLNSKEEYGSEEYGSQEYGTQEHYRTQKHYGKQEDCWIQENYEIPPIKLYELDESGNISKMTSNQYTVNLILFDGVQILYKIMSKCPMIKYNNKILWMRQNLKESVKLLLYNLINGNIIIETNIMLFRNENWIKKLPNFKIFSEDEVGNIIPTPLDKWTLEITESKYIFNFHNSNCCLVKYFENIIWKNDDSRKIINDSRKMIDYPRKMSFKIRSKILIVEFENYFDICSFNQDNWIKKQINIPPINLFKLGPEDNIINLSREDYEVELINTRFMTILFSINMNIKCVRILYKKTIVWSSNNNYPYYIIYSQCNNKLYITFDKEIIVYKYKSRNWYEKIYKIPPIELYTEINGKIILLDYNNYKIYLKDINKNICYYYIINEKCTQIKFNNKLVWKFNDKYPKSITYNNNININFGKKIIKITEK
uniref:Uncharacterized protein n=1 Tax=Theileria annulata TaxID=5874 RepID=A0A3B0N867_THEAN